MSNWQKPTSEEWMIQETLKDWFFIEYGRRFPKAFAAIPNGEYRPWSTAKRLKRQGVLKGMPDIFIALPRKEEYELTLWQPRGQITKFQTKWFHGLFIELKTDIVQNKRKPQTSPDQTEMLRLLNERGYEAFLCYGFDEAQNVIKKYMSGVIRSTVKKHEKEA